MIISVSRRTDIPAFYGEWFWNRLKAGYAEVKNPMNAQQIRRVSLTPEDVDCFVFWTKNPAPFLEGLEQLKEIPYIFQFTLNDYGQEIEGALPSCEKRVETFQKLSEKIGPKRIFWRYDPILFTKEYSEDWHLAHFEKLARKLFSATESVTVSFIDRYRKNEKNLILHGVEERTIPELEAFSKRLSEIAKGYGLSIESCAEAHDFTAAGIKPGSCINGDRLNQLFKRTGSYEKDKNQREACGCSASVDIGAYHCCLHQCIYCYANASPETVRKNHEKHRSDSPMLIP